jgi:hypothetical protein
MYGTRKPTVLYLRFQASGTGPAYVVYITLLPQISLTKQYSIKDIQSERKYIYGPANISPDKFRNLTRVLISDMPLSYIIHTWDIKLVHSLSSGAGFPHRLRVPPGCFDCCQEAIYPGAPATSHQYHHHRFTSPMQHPCITALPVSHRRLPPYVHTR